MTPKKILITGGAGFVGSSLSLLFKEKFPQSQSTVFDNLKRRGSELNLFRLRTAGVDFVHGDIRNPNDFESLGSNYDLFIEASAEPSVLAGTQGDSPLYAIQTNLMGTVHCLEFARKHCNTFVFLSTSRVYSIPALLGLPLKKRESRLELDINEENDQTGLSKNGISEEFSKQDFRSIYGTTKLASEMLIEEYARTYGLKSIINRAGVIAGPWQMGKTDQGVFTLWLAKHYFKSSLQYTGFGGEGLQVRDLLHPADLFELILKQLDTSFTGGFTFNCGGGHSNSISLKELTSLCQEITGNKISIGSNPTTQSVDIPYYVTDNTKAQKTFSWKPQKSVPVLMQEIFKWIQANEKDLSRIFNG